MMPPSGRAAKPTPSVAKAASVPVTGSPAGEERRAEVQRRGGAEADEVVGLDHGADRSRSPPRASLVPMDPGRATEEPRRSAADSFGRSRASVRRGAVTRMADQRGPNVNSQR